MTKLSIYKNGNDIIDGFAVFWDNMYKHIDADKLPTSKVRKQLLDKLLAEYGGKILRENNRVYVTFEDERDAVMFLLRWA